ncbi:thiamine-phosphate kinase [Sulfurimonas sp.]|uniref:thiamine-phosphate kinase n=1 Tax=Sulfurimonas sp. TaxID=2022749 RepID=UPI003D0C2D0C
MNLENYFISQFNNKNIGDDGAVIGKYVYSKDAFFENIHFKREWLSYFDIAKRAMLVNISDAIAMGAKPKYALLSVAMPKDMSAKDMKELASGFQEIATKYNIDIVGGDTISNTKLDITITIISQVNKTLYRKGIKQNYLLAYTGVLGESAKSLKKLQNLGKIHQKSKFIHIQLRQTFLQKTTNVLKAGMDISDGLFCDTQKLADANGLGIKFFNKIPKRIGCSGEEYEMLVAFAPRDRKKMIRLAKLSRTKLTVFANAKRGKYINRCKAHHF